MFTFRKFEKKNVEMLEKFEKIHVFFEKSTQSFEGREKDCHRMFLEKNIDLFNY